MTSLDQFIEPIKVAGQPLGNEYKAYKMDCSRENKNMRKAVNLGTCHCCDYFQLKNDTVILIEETRLMDKVQKIRNNYNYLNDDDKNKMINSVIQKRMQLKAYGSMLVLCRLAKRFSNEKSLIGIKKYHFWLVASSIDSGDEKMYFDNLKDTLRGKLKEVLGTILLDDVDVFSSDILQKKLSGK